MLLPQLEDVKKTICVKCSVLWRECECVSLLYKFVNVFISPGYPETEVKLQYVLQKLLNVTLQI